MSLGLRITDTNPNIWRVNAPPGAFAPPLSTSKVICMKKNCRNPPAPMSKRGDAWCWELLVFVRSFADFGTRFTSLRQISNVILKIRIRAWVFLGLRRVGSSVYSYRDTSRDVHHNPGPPRSFSVPFCPTLHPARPRNGRCSVRSPVSILSPPPTEGPEISR